MTHKRTYAIAVGGPVRVHCLSGMPALSCAICILQPESACSLSKKNKNIFKTLKQFLETIDKEFEIRIQHLKETHKLKECLVY
jgi:hypothetical protein